MNKNMTALVSAFVRSYHNKDNSIRVYKDLIASKILTEEEYDLISKNMVNGINYFNPNYNGNNPLKWIVNTFLAPSVLARSIFNEEHLLNEIKLGLKQYVILGSGYDTSAYKVNKYVKVLELDKKEMIDDKIKRIRANKIDDSNVTYIKCDFNKTWLSTLLKTNYDKESKTFCSLLGISYYLDKDIFKSLLISLASIIPKGSVIIFDYPNEFVSKKEQVIKSLASTAHEDMLATYTYKDIEDIAKFSNLLIYEHLTNEDINKNYFYNYNTLNPTTKLLAPIGVNYCLLVKE